MKIVSFILTIVLVSYSSCIPLSRDNPIDLVNGELNQVPSFEVNSKLPTPLELSIFGTNQEEDSMEYIFKENQNIDSGIEHYLIEGDIKVDYNVSQVAQNAVRNRNVRWPGGVVPYFIDRSFDAGARQRILAAITVTTNNLYSVYSLEWTKRLRSHRTKTGLLFGGWSKRRTPRIVGWGACNFHRGTIMHELMHAVGFQHEQTRTDRDQFVTVYYQNIQSGLEYNFVRYNQDTIDHLQTRYDYYSIMHYPMNAFSRNGRPTIVPRQAGVSIGNRNDFSATDILKINRYYGCEDTTETEGDETNPDCEETHPNCSAWAARGECSRNPAWMLPNCPVSCQQCRPSSSNCADDNVNCARWASNGECTRNPLYNEDIV
ncbi:putative zinc metalloproteinase nas-13-like [Apostichopus japonicus]|uniref:Metalloendopeptidase n=1 Tax=Stichopus japonicus TaxID=307972 RepID=A0A2G8L8Y5_STIJA|nr:putative zinc metalloproteinase nas-13-like [Apostichopus japonicus]